ncbi:UDP-glucose 4-epimerase family protein [Vibrio sp. 10N.286.48.C11]|uniref:UDP-glucose 4-epimerase family protein n=1 Tax=Vibrio sp. 10N.286.48.C11 TaxID=3229698 RepID=UPI003550B50B
MKVILTGASGFIGSKLLEQLPAKSTLSLGRKKPKIQSSEQFFNLEIGSDTDYSVALRGVDVVIHLAARVHIMEDESVEPLNDYREVNTAGTLNLAKQAAESGVKRFIFISSIKANGEHTYDNNPFSFESPRLPEDFYGQSKSEAEVQLLELAQDTGLEVVIIRPTLVYGAGVKANFASLMNLASKGFPLPFGLINSNKRSLVSVTNLVDLIVTCIEHPRAKNQVFLVSDDHDVSTSEMVREMSVACGKKNFQLPVPAWCYKFSGKLLKKEDVVDRLIGSLQVDISHTKETLDWTPPQSLQDGFKETADHILNKRGNK